MALLRLVRFPNLLLVALTQGLIYFYLLVPSFSGKGLSTALSWLDLMILIGTTTLLTAGGYIINDLMDQKADLVNKPEKVILSRLISRQTAYWLYFCFHILGFFLSIYLGFSQNKLPFLFLFPMAGIGLYLYSSMLKRIPLLGHFLISAYCAGVAGILWLAEAGTIDNLEKIAPDTTYKLRAILVAYMVFAFISNFLRELIKSMEDLPGDRQTGYRTAAVQWGIPVVRQLTWFTGMVFIVLLIFAWTKLRLYFDGLLGPAGLLLIGFVVYLLIRLGSARTAQDFGRLSQLSKIVMLAGLLLLLLIR